MKLLAIPLLLVLSLAGLVDGASGSVLGWVMAVAGVFATAFLLDVPASHDSHEASDHS